MAGADPAAEQGVLQRARQQQTDFKQQRIQQAMAILQANKQSQTTNLPLLAAAGAMLAPTRTGSFSESLGNGMTAAVQPTEVDRTRDTGLAGALGRLGIDEADVGLQGAQQDTTDYWNRMRLAQQAGSNAALVGGRMDIAAGNQDARLQVQQLRNEAIKDAAKQRADAQVEAARLRANAPPAAAKLFDYATQPRPDPSNPGSFLPPLMTEQDGISVLSPHKAGLNESDYTKYVEMEKNRLVNSQMFGGGKKLTDQQLTDQARATIDSIFRNSPSQQQKASGAAASNANPTPNGQSTAPAQAAAGSPSPSGGARAATADEQALAQKYIDQGAPRSQVIDLFKKRGITLPAGP
jgi:hypothetical protein